MARFVFLDRDGTLVRDSGYTHRIRDYELLPGVVSGLRALRTAGYRLAIVTNQSGIGRGFFDEPAYHAFQQHLLADLKKYGVAIAASFFCPHRPEAGCACRKPRPGMLQRAQKSLGAELAESFLIGDRTSDAEAALAAGCRGSVIVGPAAADDAPLPARAVRASDLKAAAAHILAQPG